MQIIDAHQHFWQFDPVRDSWINNEMLVIKKDFLPADLLPVLQNNKVDGCIVVQSDQSEKENEFQLSNAGTFDFIQGVIGWVDLQSPDVEDRLNYYSSFKKMKGFRHILQEETDRQLMLKPAFTNGISLLEKYNFTYDLLIFPDQIKYAVQLAAKYPNQKFVINHIAKPNIKDQQIVDWAKDMRALADHKNVYCKVSGMVTEANWKGWNKTDFTPYFDVIVNSFGADRIMFGSDWPVCLLAASYNQTLEIMMDYFSSFTINENAKFFALNAIKFYNL